LANRELVIDRAAQYRLDPKEHWKRYGEAVNSRRRAMRAFQGAQINASDGSYVRIARGLLTFYHLPLFVIDFDNRSFSVQHQNM